MRHRACTRARTMSKKKTQAMFERRKRQNLLNDLTQEMKDQEEKMSIIIKYHQVKGGWRCQAINRDKIVGGPCNILFSWKGSTFS